MFVNLGLGCDLVYSPLDKDNTICSVLFLNGFSSQQHLGTEDEPIPTGSGQAMPWGLQAHSHSFDHPGFRMRLRSLWGFPATNRNHHFLRKIKACLQVCSCSLCTSVGCGHSDSEPPLHWDRSQTRFNRNHLLQQRGKSQVATGTAGTLSAHRKEIAQPECALSAYLTISLSKVMETLLCSNRDREFKRRRINQTNPYGFMESRPDLSEWL